MIKIIYRLLIICFLMSGTLNHAQELNALVLDSISQNPIPFASIYLKSGSGGVSNEEGRFRLLYDQQKTLKDSLFISCMGYETLALSLSEIQDSIFYLPPKAIELNTIVVSNKQVDVDQLLKNIKENIPEKYELGLTQKKLFFRETGSQEFKRLEVKIKKTSIDEFNQAFWDSTLRKIPRKNEWYQEYAGTLFGDYSKESQKLELFKALELEDKKISALFDDIGKTFESILKENVKTTSFFKVRSGIVGGKIEGEDFTQLDLDTLSQEEKEEMEKKNFLSSKKWNATNLLKGLFKEGELNISIIKKSSKYIFELADFTYLDDTPVYILEFKPKKNADYSGKIYVDADQMTLVRLEYKNIQNITDFSMLGVSFRRDLKEVTLQFKKLSNEKYSPEYLEFSDAFEGGFKRPLVITEKNKVVKGRNKQNQLKMDLDVKTRQFSKYQLVVFETLLMDKEVFEAYEEHPTVLPVNLTEYDPTFWEGYSIIEPNQAIKAFKVIQ